MSPQLGFAGGAFGQAAPSGGFTYGMAAKGGNVFGAPAGANSNNLFSGGT